VAALILALAALSGFQQTLKQEILARTPEVEIELPASAEVSTIKDRILELPGVRSAQQMVRGRAWLVGEGRIRPVVVTGFEGNLPSTFGGDGSQPAGLYVGDGLATSWGLDVGHRLELASALPTLGPLGPEPRTRRLRLAGVYLSGQTEEHDRIAMPLEEAKALLGDSNARIVVATGDLGTALALRSRLEDIVAPGGFVRTWRDLNRGLFFALKLEKAVMFVAVLLIVVVAVLALISDLTLMIAGKQNEIGALCAMGATAHTVRRVFLWVGGILATIGGSLGAAAGLSSAWVLHRFELLKLPERVYFLDFVPFVVRGLDLVMVLSCCLGLALACSFFAARKVSNLKPTEALRR
jgi:lipoprotein-releasing system permease protein